MKISDKEALIKSETAYENLVSVVKLVQGNPPSNI